MKKYCKLFILAAALMGGLSLNSCIDLTHRLFRHQSVQIFHKRNRR